MKALRKSGPGPGLDLVEVDEPDVGPGQVKIAVLRTGICGTDLHIRSWDAWAAGAVAPPLIVGHEFCGRVVEIGDGIRDVAVGDFVSGEGHIVCGTCRNCRAGRRHLCIRTAGLGVNRDGAFAQYIVIPESNVWVHHALSADRDADVDIAAIFDPFGNAVHTALSFPLVGEDVLITGAGPIGLMAAAVARHVGARFVVITDISAPRLGPRPADGGGRRAGRQHVLHRRGAVPPRHDGRLRRRAGDVRISRRRCPTSSPTSTTGAGSRCSGFRPGRSRSTGRRWSPT